MKTILIVDDEPDIREMYGSSIQDAGYQVITACCVDQAIGIISSQVIDLVLTDEDMPEKSGHDLLRQCRELGFMTPFIISGGKVEERRHSQLFSEGFACAFSKPCLMKNIHEAIARLTAQE